MLRARPPPSRDVAWVAGVDPGSGPGRVAAASRPAEFAQHLAHHGVFLRTIRAEAQVLLDRPEGCGDGLAGLDEVEVHADAVQPPLAVDLVRARGQQRPRELAIL